MIEKLKEWWGNFLFCSAIGGTLFFIFIICNPTAWIGMLIAVLFLKLLGGN